MKFLEHRVVDASTLPDPFNVRNEQRPLIITNVKRDTRLFQYASLHMSSLWISEFDEYVYQSSGYKIFIIPSDGKSTPQNIENCLLNNGHIDQNFEYLKNKKTYEDDLAIFRKYQNYLNIEKNVEEYKKRYIHGINQAAQAFEDYKKFVSRIKKFKKLGIENGKLSFVFENVIAEDTCAIGDLS